MFFCILYTQRIKVKQIVFEKNFEKIYSERDKNHGLSVTKEEIYTLYSSLLSTKHLDGSIAEFGVYRGGTAKIICEAKGDKHLYLFDTFQGMPDNLISKEKDVWKEGTHRNTSLDLVKEYLKGYKNVHFIPGIFPDSIKKYPEVKKKSFSMVHLDVDLYQSTLDALEFFYPRMVVGARIISHNYNPSLNTREDTPGVKLAFMEYFKGKEHFIVEIADTQCMFIKPDQK